MRRIISAISVLALAFSLVASATSANAAVPGYDSAYAGESAFLNLAPGQTGTFTVFFANTGSTSWVRGTASQVDLAACLENKTTCNAQDASEAPFNSGWLSAVRYTTHTQTTVAPGQIGTFTYNVTVPAGTTSGTYRFNGALVLSATGADIHNEGYYQDVTVRAPTGAAATLTSITPVSGTTAGGTTVTITGTGFVCTATFPTVIFGTTTATVTSCGATSLTVTSPAGAAGATTITVTNTGAAASNGVTFTFVTPATTATTLTIAPSFQFNQIGRTATLTITTTDAAGAAVGNVAFTCNISDDPANLGGTATFNPPLTITGTTSSAGTGTVSYTRANPGTDIITCYVTASPTARGTAQATFGLATQTSGLSPASATNAPSSTTASAQIVDNSAGEETFRLSTTDASGTAAQLEGTTVFTVTASGGTVFILGCSGTTGTLTVNAGSTGSCTTAVGLTPHTVTIDSATRGASATVTATFTTTGGATQATQSATKTYISTVLSSTAPTGAVSGNVTFVDKRAGGCAGTSLSNPAGFYVLQVGTTSFLIEYYLGQTFAVVGSLASCDTFEAALSVGDVIVYSATDTTNHNMTANAP